jgi:hypothetical protein
MSLLGKSDDMEPQYMHALECRNGRVLQIVRVIYLTKMTLFRTGMWVLLFDARVSGDGNRMTEKRWQERN